MKKRRNNNYVLFVAFVGASSLWGLEDASTTGSAKKCILFVVTTQSSTIDIFYLYS